MVETYRVLVACTPETDKFRQRPDVILTVDGRTVSARSQRPSPLNRASASDWTRTFGRPRSTVTADLKNGRWANQNRASNDIAHAVVGPRHMACEPGLRSCFLLGGACVQMTEPAAVLRSRAAALTRGCSRHCLRLYRTTGLTGDYWEEAMTVCSPCPGANRSCYHTERHSEVPAHT